MRICVVSREYPPFFGGGIGTYTVQYSRALAAAGHTVTIITVSDDGVERRECDGDITIVRLPFIAGDDWSGPHSSIDTPGSRAAFDTFAPVSVLSMQIAEALPRLHDEFGFDIIEAPDTGALAWFLLNQRRTGGAWSRSGPAIVTCIHSPTDWIHHYNRRELSCRQDRELVWMERDSLQWSDANVCPSYAVARWAEQHGNLPAGSIEVIHYCLGEIEKTALKARARIDPSPDGTRRILFASRLEPRKGVDTLLAGFARAAASNDSNLCLDLVGQDTPIPGGKAFFGEQCLQSLVPADLRHRVVFHGKLLPEALAAMQACAHAVAIPSPMDNFPFACMEAMASGRVIIAARAGGMEQMIVPDVSGILFQPGDADACARALLRAARMTADEAQAMGQAAAARILDICGNRTIVSRRIAHYESAIRACAERVARAEPRRQSLLINAQDLCEGDAQRLARAVEIGECDFARPWLGTPGGRIVALSTPRADLPALTWKGPMALSAQAASHPAVAPLLRPGHAPDHRLAARPAALIGALLTSGFSGAVVPEIVAPIPSEHAREAQRTIKRLARRGMRKVLGGVLDAIRGGGQRGDIHIRTYHHATPGVTGGTLPEGSVEPRAGSGRNGTSA